MQFFEKEAIAMLVASGVSTALTQLGLTSGELSANQAAKVYGKWFRDAVRTGRLSPARRGNGATGTLYYRVADILNLKAADYLDANIVFKQLNTNEDGRTN